MHQKDVLFGGICDYSNFIFIYSGICNYFGWRKEEGMLLLKKRKKLKRKQMMVMMWRIILATSGCQQIFLSPLPLMCARERRGGRGARGDRVFTS
jgi:hypothetical protein